MAGAWELLKNPSVLVGVLHTDFTTIAWSLGLRRLHIPGPFQDPLTVAGMPYDHGRNQMCMSALDCGAEYCFMLDSDVVPPRDVISRLISRNQPIISGVYCRRSPPAGVPVMIKDGQWVTQYPANSLIDVDVVGAGCLLLRRDLLLSMPPIQPGHHWFSWQVDMKGILPPEECMSEDFTACYHIRKKMGLKIMVDTSVMCRHIGLGEAGYGSFAPLNVSPIG